MNLERVAQALNKAEGAEDWVYNESLGLMTKPNPNRYYFLPWSGTGECPELLVLAVSLLRGKMGAVPLCIKESKTFNAWHVYFDMGTPALCYPTMTEAALSALVEVVGQR